MNKIRINNMDIYILGISLILFMSGLQLLGRTTAYFAICLGFIIYKIIKEKYFEINIELILLLTLSLFYILFGIINQLDITRIIVDSAMFVIAYVAGLLASKFSKSKEDDLKKYIYIISFGLLLHALSNYIYTQDIGTYYEQILYDIWTKSIIPSTQVTSWCLPIIALFFYIIMARNNRIHLFEKLYVYIGLLITIYINFNVSARTNILVILLVIGSCIFMKITKILTVKKIKYKDIFKISLFFIVILTCTILFSDRIKEFTSSVLDTPLMNRVNDLGENALLKDPRVYRQGYFLFNFIDSLWGGYYFRNNIGALHNLWMDAYDSVGIIVFFILILYTLSILKSALNVYRDNNITEESKYIITGWYVIFFILFMTEPVLESGPLMFTFFIFINGYIFNLKNKKQ